MPPLNQPMPPLDTTVSFAVPLALTISAPPLRTIVALAILAADTFSVPIEPRMVETVTAPPIKFWTPLATIVLSLSISR